MISPRLCAEWLDRGVPPIWRTLDRRERDAVVDEFLAWGGRRPAAREDDPVVWGQLELARFLREKLGSLAERHSAFSHAFAVFRQRLDLAEYEAVRHELMLEFLAYLGAGRRQLRGDRAALSRWLDVDAVSERYERERARLERRIGFCVARLGALLKHLQQSSPEVSGVPLSRYLDIEEALLPLMAFPGDTRLREAALECLSSSLGPASATGATALSPSTLRLVYRSVIDERQPLWLQCAALELLGRVAPEAVADIARRRMAQGAGDAPFFLRRVAEALVHGLPTYPVHGELLEQLAASPAPFVRAGVAALLPRCPESLAWPLWHALARDAEPSVAGQALLQVAALPGTALRSEAVLATLLEVLDASPSDFVVRVVLRVAPDWLGVVRDQCPQDEAVAHARLEAACTRLNTGHPQTLLRREAAMCRERLGGVAVPAELADLRLHASTSRVPDGDPLAFARRLLPAVRRGFGFNLDVGRKRWRVLRDWIWRPRLWRFLHEAARPATDKRQNYPHTRGRVYPGLVQVPSHCVAEVSPTKVPGEPLHVAEEGGWRPWLPLLDQVLSALDQDGPVRPLNIVSTEGVTRVQVPPGVVARMRAKWRISRQFAEIAALRNWTQDSAFAPQAYLQALAACGIECRFEPHAGRDGRPYPVDDRVRRFFPAHLSVVPLPLVFFEWREYAISLYQNTLPQLLVFVAAIATWFFGQHAWINRRFRRARARIPLVLGGWGTRGKSGTERLKAAVMSALGVRVLSKTTGCEAMFLFGQPNRSLQEMFLFRPYDKATIWEQARLTQMAAALEADVMLWECMGLNPSYVRILQHDWMRDDVSTITNCFPDHEDIQGPAGVDLPLVIREFIPKSGLLYASEENMLPYLAERAEALGTPLHAVDWLEIGLLTPDILARFPYQEHPANIALVQRMFEGMGLRGDFALKEMADRVVPDLGVLKVYPESVFEGRRIEFINGMSANERYGCLGNWQRTGMDRHRLDVDPGVWTVTVVNNRADRVARSEVFAAVLVNDIGADRHYLIGGNLGGLMQFIRQAFDRLLTDLFPPDGAPDPDTLEAIIEAHLRRWRVPLQAEEADGRLEALLRGFDAGEASGVGGLARVESEAPALAEAIQAQWEADRDAVSRVAALRAAVREHRATDAGELLWGLFSERLVVVDDYHTPGNVLVRRILREAPPGARIRAMGIQNIKGTGLDFVYRWQAWDQHAKWCRQLADGDADASLAAAQALAASKELGVLESEAIAEAIAAVRVSQIGQGDLMQVLLARIEQNLAGTLAGIDAYSAQRPREGGRFWSGLIGFAERLFDADDSVRRRTRANRIYADLVSGRIASSRAALELKRLTQRQKGGWLGS